MFNGDLEVSVCKPDQQLEGFYRNGEGDEVLYIHRGGGVLRTVFGMVPFREKDYVVIPRGTTHTFELDDGHQAWLCFHTPGEIETPNRYRNRYGQLLEHAPFSQRDFHAPSGLETRDEPASYRLTVRVRDGYQEYLLDRHPFDVVGWDGYVWPYTFNADDFEPRAGRFHLPPPTHQTFQGPNFVICTFAPRMLDWDPKAVTLPYHHSNIQSEEVMFYAEGDYAARKGVEIGCITLHPSGLPHGPQPGAVEKALGAKRTDELAIMWDTFRPLRLTSLWRDIDKPEYALSWNPDKAPRGGLRMFEEAQLYSPVTRGEEGVVVHLGDDHPGANDPVYRARRARDRRGGARLDARRARARRSTTPTRSRTSGARSAASSRPSTSATPAGPSATPTRRSACRADHIPQLEEVSAGLEPLTGFRYVPAAGLVPLGEFYGSLADRVFHSTQYIRHPAAPLYTPEPDLIHEVIGHGNLLASPEFAELNLLAGQAARRCETEAGLQVPRRRLLVHDRVRRPVRGRRAARLRRRDPVELRRDRGVPVDGDPADRLPRDGDARVRHHQVPAGPLLGRVHGPPGGGAGRLLRGLRRRHAGAVEGRALPGSLTP